MDPSSVANFARKESISLASPIEELTKILILLSFQGAPALPRFKHSAIAIDNRMYVSGGFGDEGDDLIYLDTQTMNWVKPERIENHSVWRADHSAGMLILHEYSRTIISFPIFILT